MNRCGRERTKTTKLSAWERHRHQGKKINRIAEELDAKLQTLDDRHAIELAEVIRRGIAWFDAQRGKSRNRGVENGWPVGYFVEPEGVFADEPFNGQTKALPTNGRLGDAAPARHQRLDQVSEAAQLQITGDAQMVPSTKSR